MQRHGLVQRAPATAVMDVIGRLCGLQAQHLLGRGDLVKTWAMRCTLHLLPAHEYGMYGWLTPAVVTDGRITGVWSDGDDGPEIEEFA